MPLQFVESLLYRLDGIVKAGSMALKSEATRGRIIRAAEALTRDTGAGNLSLEAVAAEAGVSKGGLLYHFPSKAKLFEAMIEDYLARWGDALAARENAETANGVAKAYLEMSVGELSNKQPASGLLAALAENPDFLAPVKRSERQFLDRMKENASSPAAVLVMFLALHGLHAMKLLNTDIVTPAELEMTLSEIRRLLDLKA